MLHNNHENEEQDDVVIEPEYETDGFGRSSKEKKLQEELKRCQKEKQEYLEGWQRAKADLINRNKQFEEERRNIIKYAHEDIVNDLITVLDSFTMAFSNKEAWEKIDENWRKGVEYIHSQFYKTLEQYGLKEDDPLGKHFDPNLHDSVSTLEADSLDSDGIIGEVVQKGYSLNGKIIRPAKVKVFEFKK